jgi:hypothetical protein
MTRATGHAASARSYSRTAGNATRRAEREARSAAECYATAAECARYAAWSARRSDMWGDGFASPAELEDRVRSWTRMGDSYLRASWNATESAGFYRELAARYREMDARRAASMSS